MFGLPKVHSQTTKQIAKPDKIIDLEDDRIARSLGIEKPRMPDDSECCHNSCDNCVFNIYNEKLEEYETYMKLMRRRDSDDEDEKD